MKPARMTDGNEVLVAKPGLTIITGPVKSSKSLALINYFLSLKTAQKKYQLYQPTINVRDDAITSRAGSSLPAKKVNTVMELVRNVNTSHIGIDEAHMFKPGELKQLGKLLQQGHTIVVATLDADYRGQTFEAFSELLELKPNKVIYRQANCEVCGSTNAVHTQILTKDGELVTGSLPPVVVEDGRYVY